MGAIVVAIIIISLLLYSQKINKDVKDETMTLDQMTDAIGKHMHSTEFFTRVFTLTMKYPPLLSFCFDMMLHNSFANNSVLRNNLKPDPKFSESKLWSVIPTLAALKNGGEFREIVMSFLAGCKESEWEQTLAEINVVGTVCGISENTMVAESIFLRDLCANIMDRKQDGEWHLLHSLLDCVVFHIFFKEKA